MEIGYTGRYAADISICRVEPGLPDNGGKAGRAVGYTNEVLLSSPEDLSAVEAFHRDVIAKRYRPYEGITLEPGEEYMHLGSTITYTLKNGRTLTRRYEGAGTSSIRLLAPLETSPDLLAQTHPAFFDRGQDVKKWRISDPFGAWTVEKAWPAADSQALLDAMRTDLLAQTAEDLLHPSGRARRVGDVRGGPPARGCAARLHERQLPRDGELLAYPAPSSRRRECSTRSHLTWTPATRWGSPARAYGISPRRTARCSR